MPDKPLLFRIHAIERMAQRRVGVEDVRHILESGDVIEDYPNDSHTRVRLC